MKKILFAYAFPREKILFHIISKLLIKIGLPPLYRYFWHYTIKWTHPIQAPYSITYNVLFGLGKKYKIQLFHLHETISINLKSNEIFIGHVLPDPNTKRPDIFSWEKPSIDYIANKVVNKYPFDDRVFIIGPFSHLNEWAIDLYKKTKTVIGITGDIWCNFSNTPFENVFNKFFQLNMGIDLNDYKFSKKTFNKKGSRKFLYIGRNSNEKNTKALEDIAKNMNNFQGGSIGANIEGWKFISPFISFKHEYISELLKEYDFFINTSTYDAQVTTILEAMAWGLPVACTEESGYFEKSIIKLKTNDIEFNLKQIEYLQNLEDDILRNLVSENQILLKEKFSWKNFNSELEKVII